jgi:hypothetical protein
VICRKTTGGQGVHREVESEGHEEKYPGCNRGGDPIDEPPAKDGARSSQTNGGTNYWTPPATFTSSSVDNAPPDSDIIKLRSGGAVTITFSEPVKDPLFALVSWNGNIVKFGVPINILSYGPGPYGSGIPVLNDTDTGFYGNGEVRGVIDLPGTYSSITFTHLGKLARLYGWRSRSGSCARSCRRLAPGVGSVRTRRSEKEDPHLANIFKRNYHGC